MIINGNCKPHITSNDQIVGRSLKVYEPSFRELQIILIKSPIGLGFTLGSSDNLHRFHTDSFSGVAVKKIFEFSPARLDGRLRIGDRIRKINGIDVSKYPRGDVVKMLREVSIGDAINLTVRRSILSEISPITSVVSQNPQSTIVSSAENDVRRYTDTQETIERLEVIAPASTRIIPENRIEESQSQLSTINDEQTTNLPTNNQLQNEDTTNVIQEENPPSHPTRSQLFHFVIAMCSERNTPKPATSGTSSSLSSSSLSAPSSRASLSNNTGGVLGISVECRAMITTNNSINNNNNNNNNNYTHNNTCNTNNHDNDSNNNTDAINNNLDNDFSPLDQTNNESPGYRRFFVKSILDTGSASKDGRLQVGDEILAIQGIDIRTGLLFKLPNKITSSNESIQATAHQQDTSNTNEHETNQESIINSASLQSSSLLGDVYHYNLPIMFLKNIRKLNKYSEIHGIFEKLQEQPLCVLKSLIKEVGLIYSSISLIISRNVNDEPLRSNVDVISPTGTNANLNSFIMEKKLSNKHCLTDLCRIENIFELNPDYRYTFNEEQWIIGNGNGNEITSSSAQLSSPQQTLPTDENHEQPSTSSNQDDKQKQLQQFQEVILDEEGREALFSYFGKSDSKFGSNNHYVSCCDACYITRVADREQEDRQRIDTLNRAGEFNAANNREIGEETDGEMNGEGERIITEHYVT